MLAKIDEATPCRYGATTVLAVAYDKERTFTPTPMATGESGTEDAAIVATHLMLAATDEGVDSCWINCFHARMLHELLGLPEREELLMLLDLGYVPPKGPDHFQTIPCGNLCPRPSPEYIKKDT